jgi:TonB family protein
MAAEVLRSAYWFNPLLWMACRCLRQESEQACDDEVLARGTQADAYASELVALARDFAARRRAWAPAPAIAHSSSLERRVRAMLNPLLNRTPLSRRLRFATATAMLAVAVPVAGFGPSPSPREPDASRESTAEALRAEPSARNLPVAIVAAVTQAAPAEPATLSGTVRDQLGGLVPDVTIVLTMVDGRSRVATSRRSDQNGFFEFANLPPWDHYELRAQLPGFRTRTDVVRLPEGARVQWDLEMELGSIEETVTVVGGAAAPEPALDEGQLQRRRDFLRSQRDADPCAIAPAGGCVRPPVKIRHVNPYYPPELEVAGVEGVVLIEGVIGTNGFIATPSVRPGAHPGLEAAAVAAVTGWEFEPTRLGGVPVDTDITVTVSFDLNN